MENPEFKKSEETSPVMYNLIILDESGSMQCVRKQTIDGCNETLDSIKNTAGKHPETKQLTSIYCFDSQKSRYLFKNIPAEDVRDLTLKDYHPYACTPLYDAIGTTVSELKEVTERSHAVAAVTIITDGLENDSKEWTHPQIVGLIAELEKEGWVFAFIGANIDVAETAKGLNISNFMEWEQTETGTRTMFERERRSREAYCERRNYMRNCDFYREADEEEQRRYMQKLNHGYFMESGEHVTPDLVTHLNDNEVFVFGSNIKGYHSGGAALYAKEHFGAREGRAEGLQGKSYAIPTVGNSFRDVAAAVRRFTEFAVTHPELKFLVTRIGCGHGCYTDAEIAPLFRTAHSFGNVYLPKEFLAVIRKEEYL